MPSWKKLVKLTTVRRRKKKNKKNKYLTAAKPEPEQQDAVHEVSVTTDIHKELTNQYAREHNQAESTFPSAPVSGVESDAASSEEGTADMAAVVEELMKPLEQAVVVDVRAETEEIAVEEEQVELTAEAVETEVEDVEILEVEEASSVTEVEAAVEEAPEEAIIDAAEECKTEVSIFEASAPSSPVPAPVDTPVSEQEPVVSEPSPAAEIDDVTATIVPSPVVVAAVEENSPLSQCALTINVPGDELPESASVAVLQDLTPRVEQLEKIVLQVVEANNSLIKEIRALKQESIVSPESVEEEEEVARVPKGFFREPKLHCGERNKQRNAIKKRARRRLKNRDMVQARKQKVLEEEMEKNIREQMARNVAKARPVRKYTAVDIQLPRRKIVAGRVPIYERARNQQQQRSDRLKDMRRLRDLEQGIQRPEMDSPKKMALTSCRASGRLHDVQVLALRQ